MSTRRTVGITVAVLTAAINWFVFYWVAVKFGSQSPGFIATAVLGSIVAHELGHLIVMERYGLMTHLVFLVVLGGALPDPSSKERLDSLQWGKLANISLAGMVGNVFVGVLAMFLYWTGHLTAVEMGKVVNMNGALIFSNLIPFGIFDGGRFAKVFFDSVPENEDHSYVLRIGLVLVVVAFILIAWMGQDVISLLIFVLWGLSFRSNHDDRLGSRSPRAMTRMQQVWAAIAYTVSVCCGMVFLATTPPWPAHH